MCKMEIKIMHYKHSFRLFKNIFIKINLLFDPHNNPMEKQI